MAKRYALVPESWLSSLNGGMVRTSDFQPSNTQQVLHENVSPTVVATESKRSSNVSQMAELLPKNLKTRARIILHYLENGNVNINDMQRIVYDDGTIGSHILDLTRYAISPFLKTRPVDWPQFRDLLDKLGVPNSAIVNRNSDVAGSSSNATSAILSNWKMLY